jgi:hypothetical protein
MRRRYHGMFRFESLTPVELQHRFDGERRLLSIGGLAVTASLIACLVAMAAS